MAAMREQVERESVFTLEAAKLKFGSGAVEELGWDLGRLGLTRVFVVADPRLRSLGVLDKVADILGKAGIAARFFEDIGVEPTLASLGRAAEAAKEHDIDGFVAVGGGSTIDTAKVTNLIHCHGGAIMDYVNPPIGAGRKPPTPLKPLVAIPTTSGSGSEATTVAVLDLPEHKVKTGISHRFLRPALAVVDPELVRTTPAGVTASTGLDVVCHAIESYIAKPFHSRPRPANPEDRPPYQGSNPVADIWSAKAIGFGGQYLARAVRSNDDVEARGAMMLGATMAGIGFGSAGVHIPHACAYPIAGLRHEYQAPGYDHPFVPHGFSVIVTAPAAFRYTCDAAPERHAQAAEWLSGKRIERPGPDSLPRALIALMREVGAPSGIAELGYREADVPALVEGALKQQRLLALSPKPVDRARLEQIFLESMRNW
jgi:hydroxyacid-oxoacid transhydrogenase